MRTLACLLALLPLSACMETAAPQADPRPMQEAACAATIAAHIGRPVAQVQPRWLSETSGIALVETMDSHRRHLCRVDATGRVLDYSHPRG